MLISVLATLEDGTPDLGINHTIHLTLFTTTCPRPTGTFPTLLSATNRQTNPFVFLPRRAFIRTHPNCLLCAVMRCLLIRTSTLPGSHKGYTTYVIGTPWTVILHIQRLVNTAGKSYERSAWPIFRVFGIILAFGFRQCG